MADPFIGRTVGEYTVTARLGGRAVAPVYRVRHRRLRIERSLQVLATADPKRALDEARRLLAIRERNLIRVHDCGELEDGGIYVLQELLNGEPLDAALTREGGLSVRDALKTIRDAAAGLAHAHAAGVLHRDLRPRSIFLAREGGVQVVKAVDFRIDGPIDADAAALVARSLPPEELRHLAPEQLGQLSPGDQLDPRTDVYALGLSLWEAMTGAPAFDSMPLPTAFERRMDGLAPPSSLAGGIEPALDELVEAMTSMERSRRPADAGVVRDELDDFLMKVRRPGRPATGAPGGPASRRRVAPAAAPAIVTEPGAIPLRQPPPSEPSAPAEELLDREIVRPPVETPSASRLDAPIAPVEPIETVVQAAGGRMSGGRARLAAPRWALAVVAVAVLAMLFVPGLLDRSGSGVDATGSVAVDAADLERALAAVDEAQIWDWLGTYPQSSHRERAYIALLARGSTLDVCGHARRWSPELLDGRGDLARQCRER